VGFEKYYISDINIPDYPINDSYIGNNTSDKLMEYYVNDIVYESPDSSGFSLNNFLNSSIKFCLILYFIYSILDKKFFQNFSEFCDLNKQKFDSE
jgi:hypothetical protein